MSSAAHSEPYKLPAGVLALAVHLAFFAFLYFGVSWRNAPPQGMVVDIWNSLPDAPQTISPPVAPPVAPPEPAPAPEPAIPAPGRADIALDQQKKPKAEAQKPVPLQPVMPVPANNFPFEGGRANPTPAEQAAMQARQAQIAAQTEMMDGYKARIRNKIKDCIPSAALPPDDNARAEFDVTLLPGGSVLNSRKTRPSGYNAYDEELERCILKSQPLPLPPDPAMFNYFRELHLVFTPKDDQ